MTKKEQRNLEIMERTRNGTHQANVQRSKAKRRILKNQQKIQFEKEKKEKKEQENQTKLLIAKQMNRAVSIRARKQATTRIKREQMRCQMKQEEKELSTIGIPSNPSVLGGGGSLISPMTSPLLKHQSSSTHNTFTHAIDVHAEEGGEEEEDYMEELDLNKSLSLLKEKESDSLLPGGRGTTTMESRRQHSSSSHQQKISLHNQNVISKQGMCVKFIINRNIYISNLDNS